MIIFNTQTALCCFFHSFSVFSFFLFEFVHECQRLQADNELCMSNTCHTVNASSHILLYCRHCKSHGWKHSGDSIFNRQVLFSTNWYFIFKSTGSFLLQTHSWFYCKWSDFQCYFNFWKKTLQYDTIRGHIEMPSNDPIISSWIKSILHFLAEYAL